MQIYLVTAFLFAVVWLAAWFAVLRRLLKHYALTAGVLARIEAAEGDVRAKIRIWFEAKKTVLTAFLCSGFAAFKGAAGLAAAAAAGAAHEFGGLSPDALLPFQDKTMWAVLVGESWSLYIVSAIGILIAYLTLKGKLAAAKIVPADGAGAD